MMSAPVARTLSGFIALTVAAVPTGMNAGVRISPRRIRMRPVRALPSVPWSSKAKRGLVMVRAPSASCPQPPPGAENHRVMTVHSARKPVMPSDTANDTSELP
jgi:hypothetical protein